jgi:hypothetical protein
MRQLVSLSLGLMTLMGSALSGAHAADVDWKLYGAASFPAGEQWCFYDVQGVTQTPEGYLRVWTKCLQQKELDAVDPKQIVEDSAKRIISGYVPPIVVGDIMKFDQIPLIVPYEQIADANSINPTVRIYYELDCSQKRLHELSMRFSVNGKDKEANERPWQFVSPEGNGATLLKLLCH